MWSLRGFSQVHYEMTHLENGTVQTRRGKVTSTWELNVVRYRGTNPVIAKHGLLVIEGCGRMYFEINFMLTNCWDWTVDGTHIRITVIQIRRLLVWIPNVEYRYILGKTLHQHCRCEFSEWVVGGGQRGCCNNPDEMSSLAPISTLVISQLLLLTPKFTTTIAKEKHKCDVDACLDKHVNVRMTSLSYSIMN